MRRATINTALLLSGAILGACATSQADSVSERLRAVTDVFYVRVANVGNEICAARRDPIVEIARETAFQALTARVQENGARWEFQGIRCLGDPDTS